MYRCWRQNEAFWKLEKMIKGKNYEAALPLVDSLIYQHPEHYYLVKYRDHVNHMKRTSPEEEITFSSRMTGAYEGNRIIWKEGKNMYYSAGASGRMRLYSLPNNMFFLISRYKILLSPVMENDVIKGIQFLEYDSTLNSYQPVQFASKVK